MAEYPGFQRAKTLAAAWINALTKQGKLMNDAWGDILAGNYGPKEVLRDSAQMYQNQYDIVDALLPSDPASALDVPNWLMLDATVKLSDTVQTRSYDNVNVNLTATELVSLTGSNVRFDMGVESTGPTSLRVTVTAIYYSESGKAVALKGPDDINTAIKDKKLTAGQYIGLIYDRRAVTNAPLAIVTLVI